MAAFSSKPFYYGYVHTRMGPTATGVLRVLKFAGAIFFLVSACRFILEKL